MARPLLALLLLAIGAFTQDCQQDVQCLLDAMTLDEKLQFFAGDLDAIDHIKGVSRLGIPDINMGDGPNGVANTIAGTATSFPCNMAAGDTFDKELVGTYARAMAKEFKAKGKNQILGPGTNLNRVPECGRQDEYMAGDDPVLGAELVSAFVKGALSENMMTCVKHFGNNEQETNRNAWSANPDAFVNMELYMQPFIAAVKAGAAALMCGYNKVGGVHACKNSDIMQAIKKESDSFWIVSDWGAVYPDAANGGAADYINAGLDMEMGTHDTPTCDGHLGPDVQETKYGAAGYCNKGDYMLPDKMRALISEGKLITSRVDETVARVLKAMKTAGLLDRTVQDQYPTYEQQDLHSKWFGPLAQKDVRTQHSRQVAHEVALKAMVLMQNKGSLLPLKATDKVEMYGCGDEVHFRAEVGSAAGTEPHIPANPCQPDDETACPYPEEGMKAAGVTPQTFRLDDANAGPRDPSAIAIICVTASAKNSEGTDRANLDLLGAAIPWEKFQRAVVYVVIPGPVLIPFAPKVDAILLSSLPGEMGGAAFADIVLGKASPSGHLSLTMPNAAHETPARIQESSDDYNEDLEVGYRWYEAQNRHPNFAFGWGLSYAGCMQIVQAKMNMPAEGGRPSVSIWLWQDGQASSAGDVDQVVQLYVVFEKPQPRSFKTLAGFEKFRKLQAGAQVLKDIEFEKPRTFGAADGDKHGYGAGWQAVAEYTVLVSLHGVEAAVPLFTVADDGTSFVATPAHDFLADGPMKFDQGAAASARAEARGIAGAQAPAQCTWQTPASTVDDQRARAATALVTEEFEQRRIPLAQPQTRLPAALGLLLVAGTVLGLALRWLRPGLRAAPVSAAAVADYDGAALLTGSPEAEVEALA